MDRRHLLAGAAPIAAAPLFAAESVAAPLSTRVVRPGQSIQAALNAGPGRVFLRAGVHRLARPLKLRPLCWLDGEFGATILRPGRSMDAVIQVGGGGPIDRWRISNLAMDVNGLARTGIDVNINGTRGNQHGEPDSQGRLDNLFINDAAKQGIWYRGTESRAIVTENVRVRAAQTYAYRIENTDSWWTRCEGTTRDDSGAAFFINTVRLGPNRSWGGSNLHFDHCKAWYCRKYGWHIRGVRNTFTGCESQDTRSHGFYIQWDQNTLTGCIAESAASRGVNGLAKGADGFFVQANRSVVMVGCLALDRYTHPHQRYGFNVPRGMVRDGRLSGYAGWNNAVALIKTR